MRTTLSKFWRVCNVWVWKDARSLALLLLAYLCLRMTLGYLIFPPSVEESRTSVTAVTWLEIYLPLWVYGSLWAITGIFCMVSAYRKSDTIALALFSGMNMLWVTSYAVDYFTSMMEGDSSRAWLTALLYLGFAALSTVVIPRFKNPYAAEISSLDDT